jgi:tRNA G18 (ribose-2'-O)-methylase SpoU
MLTHGDEFNEISPETFVDMVNDAMKELYNEMCSEEGSAASAHPDITWPKGSEMALKAENAKKSQYLAESEHLEGDNLQRKIKVWEQLELNVRESKERGQPTAGSQSGLVVCASLVDKVPNLAGLTRTCEIFGAASMTLPSMQVVTSDAFTQIRYGALSTTL